MRERNSATIGRRRRARLAAVLAGILFVAAPAAAQEQESDGPFGFLKPWLKREILGNTPEAEEPATGALPDASTAPAPAAVPDASAPPLDADGDSALRGGSDAGAAAPEVSEPLPEAPAEASSQGMSEGMPESPPLAPAAVEPKPVPLRFAVLAGRSTSATMAMIGPIADDLAALLARPVEFLPFPSYDAIIDAQVDRRIDGGFFSAAAFALADARCSCLEPIVAPRAFDGTLAYHAIVVARVDSGIGAIADLEGKTVAIGAEDSIGGRRMQLAGLLSEGVDPATFGAVVETDSAEAAVRLVAARRADAAFAWSSLAGNAAAGYSRGTLTDLVAEGAVAADDIAVLWRSPAIEHGPFALMRTLDEAEKGKIEAYLLSLMSANPAAYDGLNPLYGGGYAQVDPRDYAGLEMLAVQDIDALVMPKAVAVQPLPAEPAIAEPPPPAESPQQ